MNAAGNSQRTPLAALITMAGIVLFNIGIIVGLVLQAFPGLGYWQVLVLVLAEAAVVLYAYRTGKRAQKVSVRV